MYLSKSFFYTIREDIKDEESQSSNLMVKSGMVKKVGNGIYMYMPLGLKVLENVKRIIKEEMDSAGACELLMPSLLPEDVYVKSGRRAIFGDDMFSLQDRYHRNYALGPTHEELFVTAASMKVKSYKDMPFNIYQIGNKYRDEPRPRYGLIRVREFFMKDAYSFDKDNEGLDVSYQKMFQAYKNIFDRMQIDYRIVKADTGAMGGQLSEEFQALSPIGEDTLVICNHCGYASNIEVSECKENPKETKEAKLPKELIHTPNVGKIQDLIDYLKIDVNKLTKTLIYKVDGKYYACMVKGNREINELKIKNLLGAKEIELAEPEIVGEITKASVGFAGPIGINIPVVIDYEVKYMHNFLVGANKTDYHYLNTNIEDFEYQYIGDIKNVEENDPCPNCNHPLTFQKGIEIGNTFKLGTKYSEALGLKYLNENNELKPVVMGCYGIGLGRVIAAVAEQNHDDKGLIWPISIAPYKVAIVTINNKDEQQVKLSEQLYKELEQLGIEPLLDDREERPGVKFNDMDLIGIPIRISVGKKAGENIVEYKKRNETEVLELTPSEVIEKIKNEIKEN